MNKLPADARDLATAEDFLEYFDVPFDQKIVDVNRLHILQRFHDYMASAEADGLDEAGRTDLARGMLERAYEDFVRSDALVERVFKVLKTAKSEPTPRSRKFVPLEDVARVRPAKKE